MEVQDVDGAYKSAINQQIKSMSIYETKNYYQVGISPEVKTESVCYL